MGSPELQQRAVTVEVEGLRRMSPTHLSSRDVEGGGDEGRAVAVGKGGAAGGGWGLHSTPEGPCD